MNKKFVDKDAYKDRLKNAFSKDNYNKIIARLEELKRLKNKKVKE
jgi:hypothetical protein